MPGNSGRIGTYKIEVESPIGHGNFETTGVGSDRETREALSTSFNYFKANKKKHKFKYKYRNNRLLVTYTRLTMYRTIKIYF